MAGIWRLTRNRYGRALYDALTARGVTATWMCEYVNDLDAETPRPDTKRSFVVGACDTGRVVPLDAPVEQLLDTEQVIGAFEGGTPLGYLFLSVDATHEVAPLERSLSFEGAYVRRVFVGRDHRQRGVASALLGAACDSARERDAGRVTALVALDNRPSRGLFEKHRFRIIRDRRYARLGPFSARSTRER